MWQYAKRYVDTVDAVAHEMFRQFQMTDKVRIVMCITWVWAILGLYTAKAFELLFKLVLQMPDKWLNTTDTVNGVKILHASDGQSDITNKFKLFLKYYWENNEPGGGFSFASLQRLLNCSMLYCSYLLTDKNGMVSPDKFWQQANLFLVEMQNNSVVIRNSVMADPQEVPFGYVRFGSKQNIKAANDEMRDSLLAAMEPNIVQRLASRFDAGM